MSRTIVFFGNCHARALADFVAHELAGEDVIRVVSIDAPNPSDAAVLLSADVIAEQVFDFDQREMPSGIPIVRFPTVLGPYLWPFARQAHIRMEAHPFTPGGNWGIDWGDSYMNGMIRRGVPTDEALSAYLSLDINEHIGLDRVCELHFAGQRARDEKSDIQVCSIIVDRLPHELLFHSFGHAAMRLFGVVAEVVALRLGYSLQSIEGGLARLTESPLSFGWDSIPIHPSLIRHFDLRWTDPDHVYLDPNWGPMTFEQWARRYLEFDWNRDAIEGMWLADRGDEGAMPMLERAITRNPGAVKALDALGRLYLRAGRIPDAIRVFRQAADVNTVNSRSLVALGQAHRAQGDLAGLEQAWREAIAKFRVPWQVYFELATAVEQQGRHDEAKALRETGLSLQFR